MNIIEMIKNLEEVAADLPNGLNSEVIVGDYENNYLACETVEVQIDESNGVAFIGFEPHEDYKFENDADDEEEGET